MKNYPTYGMRPVDCLEHIPPHLRTHHEFCFYLHDQMAALLVEYEAAGIHRLVSDGVRGAAAEQNYEGDVLELLKKAGLTQARKHMLLSHLILALTSDMLHFIFEGLRCLERRKFAVAFSLLRKPFKENMLFLAWLLGDPEDFFNRFERDNYSTLNSVKPERRQELLGLAAGKLPTSSLFDAGLIERMVFSKTQANGLEPIWQKATHLITSQGVNLKTEDLNINFIFNNASSDHLYDAAYDQLPYLMLFLTQLVLRTFSEAAHTNVTTTNHLVVTSLGVFECLDSSSLGPMTKGLIRSLRPLLKCVHCAKPIRFKRDTALEMFLQERVRCAKCGLISDVPFYWLLAHSKMDLMPEDGGNAFDSFLKEISSRSDSGGKDALRPGSRVNAG